MTAHDAQSIYLKVKNHRSDYIEELHCPMIIRNMLHFGTVSSFCVEAFVSDQTFYNWANRHELFRECYLLAKMHAREQWEEEGRMLRHRVLEKGETDHSFEYWRMIGWSRYGVGKNSRIRLELDPNAKPNDQYAQLLKQAASGDFTAGEIKQLMEAINVGLNAHQVFTLQKEIDELKSNLDKMSTNQNAHDSFATKRVTQKD